MTERLLCMEDDAAQARLVQKCLERAGYLPEEHVTAPDLQKRHPRDLLYYVVPQGYRPDRPAGLIVR